MKTFFIVLFFSAFGITGASYAQDKITIICKSGDASCPGKIIVCDSKNEQCHGAGFSSLSDSIPPMPPAPPAPAALPAPPAPPAPPKFLVPAETHLACVGKKIGTEITWKFEKNSHITGSCSERNGKAFFKVSHWHMENLVTQ